jgi:hypothetical protein
MSAEPAIPFGWKRITGQSQRGDGIWNGTKFVKVKKEYPHSEGRPGFYFIIRKCQVVQPALPGTEQAAAEQTITVHDGNGNNVRHLNRAEYEAIKASGMLWEFHPDAPLNWPEDTLAEDPKKWATPVETVEME